MAGYTPGRPPLGAAGLRPPLDLYGAVGLRPPCFPPLGLPGIRAPLAGTRPRAPPPSATRPPGARAFAGHLRAPAPGVTPPGLSAAAKKFAPKHLSGLPSLGSSGDSADDVMSDWLFVAEQMQEKEAAEEAKVAPQPEIPPELIKALAAAAATNKDAPGNTADTQGLISNWLANAAGGGNAMSAPLDVIAAHGMPEIGVPTKAILKAKEIIASEAQSKIDEAAAYQKLLLKGQAEQEQIIQEAMAKKQALEMAMANAAAFPSASSSGAYDPSAYTSGMHLMGKASAPAPPPDMHQFDPEASIESTVQAAQRIAAQQAFEAECQALAPPIAPGKTGMEMLHELGMTATPAQSGSSSSGPAVGGYAMASIMHRAAENAKRNKQSVMAGKDGKSEEKADEGLQLTGLLFLGKLPPGTSQALIYAECSNYGTVSAVHYDSEAYDEENFGAYSLIKFTTEAGAATAVQKMSRRAGLFGSMELLEVRLATSEDVDRAKPVAPPVDEEALKALAAQASAPSPAPAPALANYQNQQDRPTREDIERDRGRDQRRGDDRDRRDNRGRDRSRDRNRGRSRSRGDRRGDRDDRRDDRRQDEAPRRKKRKWDSSEESPLNKDSGFEKKNAPPVPVEKVRKGGSGGFGANPEPASVMATGVVQGATPAAAAFLASQSGMNLSMALAGGIAPDAPQGGRQVGTKGHWAQFATTGNRQYYVNLLNGERTWVRPMEYDSLASRIGNVDVNGARMKDAHSNVYVGGLPPGVDDLTLRQLFLPFGRIMTLKVVPSKVPSGDNFGFVKFGSYPEAQAAITAVNGASIHGKLLNVRFATQDKLR